MSRRVNRRRFLKQAALAAGVTAWPLKVGVKTKEARGEKKPAHEPAARAGMIDCYSHFSCMSVIDYLESAGGPRPHVFRSLFANTPTLIDVESRLTLMDETGVARSVLVPLPWIETAPAVHADPEKCLHAARILNDALADIAARRPDRFCAVALLPTANEAVMTAEFRRAVNDLKMKGGFFVVGPTVKRPDHADYETLYQMAVDMDVPLWLHPSRPPTYADYEDEASSRYQVWQSLSWLQDSSTAMVRIVFSGVFDRYPDLKLIIHHHGALLPLFAERMQYGWEYFEQNTGKKQTTDISAPYIEHFKKFYCDTATQGVSPRLLEMAGEFFGTHRMLFGSDAPMDATAGRAFTRDAIESVSQMAVPEEDKTKIFTGTARKLLKLDSVSGGRMEV